MCDKSRSLKTDEVEVKDVFKTGSLKKIILRRLWYFLLFWRHLQVFVTYTYLLNYCSALFFRCILISQFSYVENSLHFNLADIYYQNSCHIIVYILQRILWVILQKW